MVSEARQCEGESGNGEWGDVGTGIKLWSVRIGRR
jgi:hypothetical protein